MRPVAEVAVAVQCVFREVRGLVFFQLIFRGNGAGTPASATDLFHQHISSRHAFGRAADIQLLIVRDDFRDDGVIRLPDAVEPIRHEAAFELLFDGLGGGDFRDGRFRDAAGIRRAGLGKAINLGGVVAPQHPFLGEYPAAKEEFAGTLGERNDADGGNFVRDDSDKIRDTDLTSAAIATIHVGSQSDNAAIPEPADERHVAMTNDIALRVQKLDLKG